LDLLAVLCTDYQRKNSFDARKPKQPPNGGCFNLFNSDSPTESLLHQIKLETRGKVVVVVGAVVA